MDRFAEAGGNFIDTADVYSAGRSEEIVGDWLKGKDREDFVLATKVRFGTMGRTRINRSGLSRKHIAAEVDASLRRLQVDYIDLYQVHCGTATRRSKRRCRRSTTSCAPARSATSAPATIPAAAAEGDRPRQGQRLGAVHLPAGALQPARPRARMGAAADCPRRGPGRAAVEPAARRLAVGQVPSRHERAGGRRPHRDRRPRRLERDLGALRQRVHLERGRRAHRRRQGARQGAGPGGAQLAAPPAGRHRADHRRPHHGAARQQHRRRRLGAGRRRAEALTAASDRPLPYPYDFHANAGAR